MKPYNLRVRAFCKHKKRMLYQDWGSFRNWYTEHHLGFAVIERDFPHEKTDMSEPMLFSGVEDRLGKPIYENDIVKYWWGGTLSYGIVELKNNECIGDSGWHIKTWCGDSPYGYDCESIEWNCLEVVGNTYENEDFLESIKYGVTNGDKPRTREGIKSIIMTSLKKENRSYNGGFIPSQVNIMYSGIADRKLGDELRDELVREGKLIQDPKRPWMVKVKE
jgi:uncharacterized phage protein (TIGR01671 family)